MNTLIFVDPENSRLHGPIRTWHGNLVDRVGAAAGQGVSMVAIMAARFALVLLCLIICPSANAFPPAPHHLIYGTVRDEMGNPLWTQGAIVILETESGVLLKGEIVSGLELGANYKIAIPLDAGATPDAYRFNALKAAVPFKLRVQVGKSIYLPIEMSGNFSRVGEAAQSTRIDLTLGEDKNGNGLPDAWERAIIAASGGKISEVQPEDDPDQDGLNNLQEYQAGTFAFDIHDGFSLKVVELSASGGMLEFMSVRGRTYSLFGSRDLDDWQPVSFRLAGDAANLPERQSYQAVDSKVVKVSIQQQARESNFQFFKLRAQ